MPADPERASVAFQPPAPGSVLGPYRIVAELGRGGMGVVWRAVDTRLGREVALKMIAGLADRTATDRFVREARALARLRHPGVVQVLEADSISGVAFVALELVAGGSLEQKLAPGPLAPRDAAALIRDLALAVQAAHDEGIVHRDLKPANVLLEADGRPRLADFGLARDERGTTLTVTGTMVGTPGYMAPEQVGAERGAVGPWTDVYGLGALLYRTLAGSPPFVGADLAVARRVVSEPVESPSRRRAALGLPPLARDLETICMKALEKRPEARYASARALSEDLARLLAGEAIAARPLGALESAGRAVRRHRALAAAATLVALAAIATAALIAHVARAEHRARVARMRSELEAAEKSFASARQKPLTRRATPAAFMLQRALIDRATRAVFLACELAAESDAETRALRERVARDVFDEALLFDELELAEVACDLLGDAPRRGKLDAAKVHFQDRADARLLALEADIAMQQRRVTLAQRLVARAEAKDPGSVELVWFRATEATDLADIPRALALTERLVAVEPRSASAWALRARVLLLASDMPRSEEAIARARSLDPDDEEALESQIFAAISKNEIGVAREAARRLQVVVHQPQGFFFEALVAQHEGRLPEMVRLLEEAIAIDPDFEKARLLLGQTLIQLERRDEARPQLEAVLASAAPGSFDANEARRLLALLQGR